MENTRSLYVSNNSRKASRSPCWQALMTCLSTNRSAMTACRSIRSPVAKANKILDDGNSRFLPNRSTDHADSHLRHTKRTHRTHWTYWTFDRLIAQSTRERERQRPISTYPARHLTLKSVGGFVL